MAQNPNSQRPKPPLKYAAPAPAKKIALNCRRCGSLRREHRAIMIMATTMGEKRTGNERPIWDWGDIVTYLFYRRLILGLLGTTGSDAPGAAQQRVESYPGALSSCGIPGEPARSMVAEIDAAEFPNQLL